MAILDDYIYHIMNDLDMGIFMYGNDGTQIYRNIAAVRFETDIELEALLISETILETESKDGQYILLLRSIFMEAGKLIILSPFKASVYKQFKEALRTQEEFDTIINSIHDEIFITDDKGVVLSVNNACERLYNIKAGDLKGRNVKELEKQGIFSPTITEIVVKSKETQTVVQTTKLGRRILVTAVPIFNSENEVIRVVSNSRDLTELINLRKQLEEKEQIVQQYTRTIRELKVENDDDEKLLYASKTMEKVHHLIEKVAPSDISILLLGESGVGKTMIAQIIHNSSMRKDKPFQVINCSAIPESLLESELFGYEKGAYTGALKEGKSGLFELAEGGTVFLDEIGELSLNMQTKLLQVIQERRFRKIGGLKDQSTNFRLITATNQDLAERIKKKAFREDFFYRINGISLNVPSLRERRDDIIVLANYFLEQSNMKYNNSKRFSKEVLDLFYKYDWPGNVRQLKNLIERLCLTSEYDLIMLSDLPDTVYTQLSGYLPDTDRVFSGTVGFPSLNEAIELLEEELIKRAYNKYKNSYKVAEALNISQPTAFRKIKKYINAEMN